MKLMNLLLALVLSLVTVNLAGLNATLYNLRGERIAPVSVPESATLPAVINSQAANRAGYILPESLPCGIYIVAPQSPWEELISPTRGYPVFLDMTSTFLPNEQLSQGGCAIADFNGDGFDDIFLTLEGWPDDGPFQPRLWMGQASGVFQDETATRLPVVNAPAWFPVAFDMDNDDDLDIFMLCREEYPNPLMLINDGGGYFTVGPASLFPDLMLPDRMLMEACVVDVDQDGYPDIIVTEMEETYDTYYSLWKNNAGQGFVKDSSGRLPDAQLAVYGKGRVYAHDYNSDGYPELFLCHDINHHMPYAPYNGQDIMLLNDGSGYFQIPAVNPLPVEDIYSTFYYFADTDGDGDDDIIRVDLNFDGSPNLTLLVREAGSYVPSPNSFPSSDLFHNGLVIGDFDLDGDLDIYAARVDLGLNAPDWYLSNVGNNTFELIPQALPPIIDFTVDCALINHPGDERPDIFVVNSGVNYGTVGLNRLYINDHTTATDDPLAPPAGISVYPNPFRGSTTLKLTGPTSAQSPLDIYNLRGQKVQTLFPEGSDTMAYSVSWNGTDARGNHLSAGIYFAKVRNSASVKVARLLLLR
ncbi:MAG: FG-GAP-like repeat-containing protein [Candidatus Cloacimonetes bacterium]|nr:FG-GAP-like repeat-containing protein [Candidatus Cloacimonadota bacterium]MDD3562222.1 FG-GAP-like repeat-containing protein [Candidatus Cloacimonadota bacterium]MDD4276350.1 FG-GAP-like repeat-containing protein [Candidatus Cloacimonadota bacterium]